MKMNTKKKIRLKSNDFPDVITILKTKKGKFHYQMTWKETKKKLRETERYQTPAAAYRSAINTLKAIKAGVCEF